MMNLNGLSFCESIYASGITRWHLRELTEAGKKTGGGIDTPSLCSLIQAHKGWDLEVPVTEDRVTNIEVCCPACAERVKERR